MMLVRAAHSQRQAEFLVEADHVSSRRAAEFLCGSESK